MFPSKTEIWANLPKILMLLIIVIGFVTSVYFATKILEKQCSVGYIYDDKLKKCRIQCDDDKTYYPDLDECRQCPPGRQYVDGDCLLPCSDVNNKRCGEKCYDPNVQGCVDGQLCAINKVCPHRDPPTNLYTGVVGVTGSTGPTGPTGPVCCGDGLYCKDNSYCSRCPSGTECGAGCCPTGTTCVNGACCKDAITCKLPDGSTTCCHTECCNGICCNPDQSCQDGECKTTCGDTFCKLNEQCFQYTDSNGKISYDCYNKQNNCSWGDLTYVPQMIEDDTSKQFAVCKTNTNNRLAVCNNAYGGDTPYSRTSNVVGNGNCGASDCKFKINQNDLYYVAYDQNSQNCEGEFDCKKKLPSCDSDQDKCPLSNNSKASCCKDGNGNYTGIVCPDGQTCYNDFQCGYGWKPGTTPGTCEITTERGSGTYKTEGECIAAEWHWLPDTTSTKPKCIMSKPTEHTYGTEVACMYGQSYKICPEFQKNVPTWPTCTSLAFSGGVNQKFPPGVCGRQFDPNLWTPDVVYKEMKPGNALKIKLDCPYNSTCNKNNGESYPNGCNFNFYKQSNNNHFGEWENKGNTGQYAVCSIGSDYYRGYGTGKDGVDGGVVEICCPRGTQHPNCQPKDGKDKNNQPYLYSILNKDEIIDWPGCQYGPPYGNDAKILSECKNVDNTVV